MNKSDQAAALVCCLDCESAFEPSQPLEQRFRAVFTKAKSFWMSDDENVRFQGALAAVLKRSTDESEKDLITRSALQIGRSAAMLNAVLAGVPVDLEAMPMPDPDLLPLLRWYREAKP